MSDGVNPSTAQARVLVDELVRCGVADAVLCPGSRNAPLAFALFDADAAGRLRLHVRVDERTAGFLALGLALGSGRPVPVVTTSGTAVANLHPAVLEASYAGVPLLAVTADRPPELVGSGASQTIDQRGIFGGAVRAEAALPLAGDTAGTARAGQRWRAVVRRLVAAAAGALGGPPGPVQLNVPFAEPLVPDPAQPDRAPDAPQDDRWRHGRTAHAAPGNGSRPAALAPPAVDLPTLPLDPRLPTLVVAGSGHGVDPGLLGGAPVVAEPTSPSWPYALRTGPWLLRLLADGLLPAPEQVVVVGRPTLHRSVQGLLADPRVRVFAVADPRGLPWPDVAGTVRAVGALPRLQPSLRWREAWETADAIAAKTLDAVLDAREPGGLRLARDLVAALPGGARLVLGSSNPVRDVSLAAAPRRLDVLANRGVAGIDGTVSTAVGAALTWPRPAFLLLGDLTLLHDTTGLLLGPEEPRPDLTIVVLNDSGGGIFSLLEQGAPAYATAFERIFGTPHHADLRSLAAAFGAGYELVEGAIGARLEPADGLRLLEVRADRGRLRDDHAAVAEEIRGALS